MIKKGGKAKKSASMATPFKKKAPTSKEIYSEHKKSNKTAQKLMALLTGSWFVKPKKKPANKTVARKKSVSRRKK